MVEPAGSESPSDGGISGLIRTGLLGTLLLLILLATLQLYFTVQEVIRYWFADEYVPVFNAVFFIIVIIGALLLIRAYLLPRG
ncbi:hypothetical protein [Methanosphaerula subterraneus]|uniref:hypothetical protein n=1 Tax=Methanosphaerula subterraneus TaxID=3350244 RepID=UPI003F83A5A3